LSSNEASLDDLIRRVNTRIEAARSGDAEAPWAPEVDDEAAMVRAAATADQIPSGRQAAAIAALGNLSWTRYRLRPAEAGPELHSAITMFESILTIRPDLIPETVLDALISAQAPESADPPLEDEQASVQHAALLLAVTAIVERPDLLEEAIDRLRTALGTALPPGLHAGVLADLGLALVRRFWSAGSPARGGRRADVDGAVAAYRRALELMPDEDGDQIVVLTNLGVALRYRFERFGALADLDEAVEMGRRSVQVPGGDDGTASFNLSSTVRLRFQVAGRQEDLETAVASARAAIGNLASADPRRAVRGAALANALQMRYENTGAARDLDEAIALGERAAAAPVLAERDRSAILSNLSKSLQVRYAAFGEDEDLSRALDGGRRALLQLPPGHPRRAAALTNLGNVLRLLFERHGDSAYLIEAVQLSQEAVQQTPEQDRSRAGRLNNLANVLAIRSGTSAAEAFDQERALRASRAAVDASDEADRIPLLVNLAARLRDRHRTSRSDADLDEAAGHLRTALARLPELHPDRATVAGNLAVIRFLQFTRSEDTDAAVDAVRLWQEAVRSPGARAGSRLAAARDWAQSLCSYGMFWDGAEGYGEAIGLLPLVAWRGIARASQEYQLTRTDGLARDASAAALAAGRADEALTWLDAGRAVLWSYQLAGSSDVSRLARADPDLARRALALHALLDAPGTISAAL
jgi:hypothetical protein